MARDSKIEVAALNLRISEPNKRDYAALLKQLSGSRQGIRIYGDSHLIITHFNEKTGLGVLSKYTEIEVSGQWFDTERLDAASAEDVGKISIPTKLKPNLSQFYFQLDSSIHTVAFEAYSDSKALSLHGVAKFFDVALGDEGVTRQFGRVESDIISSFQAAQSLLELPDLKEVRIIIRRPNTDDLGDDLAKEIEERLKKQNGSQYEEALKSGGQNTLKPDARTKKLATVAAENGDVTVQNLVNGVKTRSRSSDTPLKEVEKFQADEASLPRFYAVAKRLFDKVRQARREVRA